MTEQETDSTSTSTVRSAREVTDVDVIVIGSGLGGMTAANRLAQLGHSVMLIEAHYLFGGLATWFKRAPSHILDISLHGFPYGMVKTCRKYWSKEIADRIHQLKGIRFDNPQFSLETTFDRVDFTRIMRETFGIEQATIDGFFDTARKMDFFDDAGTTTRQLFQRFFPGKEGLWRLLMEPITYANGSTLDDPAISYGIVFSNFMNKGVFTFEGGTDWLIKAMVAELKKNGVILKHSTKVDQILIERSAGHAPAGSADVSSARAQQNQAGETRALPERRVVGVRCGDDVYRAKAVVSNAALMSTVKYLAGLEHFPPDFARKADAVRLNTSSCQIYFGIKKGEKIPYIGDLFFTSTWPEYDADALVSKWPSSRTYSVYYPDTRPERGERYTIVCSTNARFEDWAYLPEDEYLRDKQRLIDETLTALEHYLPGVSKIIDYIEASTPRTFKRYALAPGGSSFGTKWEGLEISTGIPDHVAGLWHAGSVAIIMSGWLGAANYGIITANKVDHYLYNLSSQAKTSST